MRIFALAVTLALIVPLTVSAQHDASAKLRQRIPHATAFPGVELPAFQTPSRSVRRCCNRKGALIGGLIGATLGAWLTASVCDAGDCTSTYLRYMAISGGIGAGVGAFADARHQPTGPFQIREDQHPRAIPVPKTRTGIVKWRF